VVRITTSAGLTGIGEVESNPWVIKSLIEAPGSNFLNRGLGELLVGRDPSNPAILWDHLYERTLVTGRRGAGICALGAIDMAIWDICGKANGKPIWQLLSQRPQQTITPYASLLPHGKTLKEYRDSLLAKVVWARDHGFKGAKMEILLKGPCARTCLTESNDAIVEMVAACRQAVGPDLVLMLDVGYAWTGWKEALEVLRSLEKYDLFFVETPLPSDDLEGYARLVEATDIRIAAGELLQTRFEFADLMDRGHVDVVQPDVGRVGGITEAMRVVQMAHDRGKIVIPHCWKSGISIAATVHVAAASSNCPFIEFLPAGVSESPLRRELVEDEVEFEDGFIALPSRPGLGIEINSAAMARFAETAEAYLMARANLSG
jgi:L-alanine-DL-glutamate epimerase-like enolase superfamily enzyme